MQLVKELRLQPLEVEVELRGQLQAGVDEDPEAAALMEAKADHDRAEENTPALAAAAAAAVGLVGC